MKLNEIFDHLSYGEFSQLHLGNQDGDFGITPENRHRMVSHINLGLTELHKRFLLKEGRHQVFLVPGLREYTIQADDILKIEQVFVDGQLLPLNDESKPNSVFTTAFNVLVVPTGAAWPTLDVVYRANHAQLGARDASREPERVDVNLPRTHLEALLYFVASRVVNPIGMAGEFHEGNNYAAKFEQACRVLESGGYQISQEAEKTKFQRNGWV